MIQTSNNPDWFHRLFAMLKERSCELGIRLQYGTDYEGSSLECMFQHKNPDDMASSRLWLNSIQDNAHEGKDGDTHHIVTANGNIVFAIVCMDGRRMIQIIYGIITNTTTSEEVRSEHSNEKSVEKVKAIKWSYDDLRAIADRDKEIESFGSQLSETYEEINLLYRIVQNMTVAMDPIRFVEQLCIELRGVINLRWVGIFLKNSAFSGAPSEGLVVDDGETLLGTAENKSLVIRLGLQHGSTEALVIDTSEDAWSQYRGLGNNIVVHPLISQNKVIGTILASDKLSNDSQFLWADLKMIDASASHLRIFLENALLYDDKQAMFLGTLEALTASIDAKDPYTCGHSLRVAYLAKELAKMHALDDEIVERVHIAGLVHDVGKIGVPESILCKPGKLTSEEFDAIKLHPSIGVKILADIPNFDDILPGVMHHHERIDGMGYPHGLKGQNIPLFGRLLAVVDSFDAMSSTRQYRTALSRKKVLEEMKKCAGTQFDHNLVTSFLRIDLAEYDRLVAIHKASSDSIRGIAA